MVTVKRSVVKTGGKPSTTNTRVSTRVSSSTRQRVIDDEMDLSIPDGPVPVSKTLATAAIYLYGESGIGKTEFSSKFPKAIHMMFEPGAEWLQIPRIPRQGQFVHWAQYDKAIDNLIGSGKYDNVIHDTADFAWDLCAQDIYEAAGEADINSGKLGYNVGNKRHVATFRKAILKITGSGRGAMFISHSKYEEFEKVTGIKSTKMIGYTEKRGREFLDGFCDLVMCYTYVNGERYLIIRGSDNVFAKCRIPDHFLTPDGEQVFAIPMGDSADESYANFMAAYNNKQDDPCILNRVPELSTRKAKWKVK